MKEWTKLRNSNANYIINKIKELHIVNVPEIDKNYVHAFYKLYITLNNEFIKPGKNRSNILDALISEGVNASFGSCGRIFAEKAFKNTKTIPNGLPVSSLLERNSIMLQVHPTMTAKELKHTAKTLHKVSIRPSKMIEKLANSLIALPRIQKLSLVICIDILSMCSVWIIFGPPLSTAMSQNFNAGLIALILTDTTQIIFPVFITVSFLFTGFYRSMIRFYDLLDTFFLSITGSLIFWIIMAAYLFKVSTRTLV